MNLSREKVNLIFLVSQPRSGSSMLQQIIISHQAVSSLPEPWIMLPLIFSIKSLNSKSSYNDKFATINIKFFLKTIGVSESHYFQQIGCIAKELYIEALKKGSSTSYFLDKTPRYYHIIPELQIAFPESKIILLSRNPLSTFGSILDYNFKGKLNWLSQIDRLHDLFTAPLEIIKHKDSPNVLWIRYEDIIQNKNNIISLVFSFLGLKTEDSLTLGKYELTEDFEKSPFRDNKSLHKHQMPVPNYLESWKKSINTTQKKRIAIEYLEKLGKDSITQLGYSFDETLASLKAHRVKKSYFTLSFKEMSNNYSRGLTFWRRVKRRSYISLCNKLNLW